MKPPCLISCRVNFVSPIAEKPKRNRQQATGGLLKAALRLIDYRGCIGQAELPQFAPRKLAFCNAMQINAFTPHEPATSDELAERMIIGLERTVRRDLAELARKPDSIDLFQREPVIKPAKRLLALLALSPLPVSAGNRFDFPQQSGFRVDIEGTSPEPFRCHRPDAATTPRIEHTDRPIVHERVSLDEFEQVGLDVSADDAVGFDHGTSLGINIVPRPAHLRMQPAFQWAEQIGESLALDMGTLDPFKFRQ